MYYKYNKIHHFIITRGVWRRVPRIPPSQLQARRPMIWLTLKTSSPCWCYAPCLQGRRDQTDDYNIIACVTKYYTKNNMLRTHQPFPLTHYLSSTFLHSGYLLRVMRHFDWHTHMFTATLFCHVYLHVHMWQYIICWPTHGWAALSKLDSTLRLQDIS